jgi:hypothetical protein
VAFSSEGSSWIVGTSQPPIELHPRGVSAHWHRGGVLSYTVRELGQDMTAVVVPPGAPRLLGVRMDHPGVSLDGSMIAFVRDGALVVETIDGTPLVDPIAGVFHGLTFAPGNETVFATRDNGELIAVGLDGTITSIGTGTIPYTSSLNAVASGGRTVLVRDGVGLAELTLATREKRYLALRDGGWFWPSAAYVDDQTILYAVHMQLSPGDVADLHAEAALDRAGDTHNLVSSRGYVPCYGSGHLGRNAFLLHCAGYAHVIDLEEPAVVDKTAAVEILGFHPDGRSAFLHDGGGTVTQLFADGSSARVAYITAGHRKATYTQR